MSTRYPFLTGQCVVCGRIDSTSSWPSSMLLTRRGLECIEHSFPTEEEYMAAQDDYCGQFTFGGVGFGAVTGNVKLGDGSTWSFSGKMFEVGTANVGYGNVDCDGFAGESHMEGECSFTIADGGLGPGGFVITFYDLHGGIGTVYGYAFGGGAAFGGGWGYWTKQTGEVATDEQRDAIAKKIAESQVKS